MSKVPVDPNGSPLVNSADPGVHTHFLYRASTLANSDVTGAIVHITEHGISKGIRIYTALASAAGLTALSDFVPASRIGIRESSEDAIATQAISGDLNPADSFLGLWLGLYPVFTKAWMPANYYLIFAGNELEKPLAMREREQSSLRGLVTVPADMAQYPLGFRTFESEFGFGAFSRAMASVLYIGNTSWSDATI